jgi:hypothetical protein
MEDGDLIPAENMPSIKSFYNGIDLIVGEMIPDTWNKVIYDAPDRQQELEKYFLLLKRELSLYPSGYHSKAGIGKIVLGKNLSFNDEYRAAVPDPYRRRLYISVNGSYGESGETYLAHVLHHEIHHMVEYAVWKDMYFEWAEWNRLNPEGFSYGRGSKGYKDMEPDYYSVNHPLKGFLNLYSMTGGEEDRCELAAFIMSAMERQVFLKYLKTDRFLQNKVRFLSRHINDFAGEEFIDIEKLLG